MIIDSQDHNLVLSSHFGLHLYTSDDFEPTTEISGLNCWAFKLIEPIAATASTTASDTVAIVTVDFQY